MGHTSPCDLVHQPCWLTGDVSLFEVTWFGQTVSSGPRSVFVPKGISTRVQRADNEFEVDFVAFELNHTTFCCPNILGLCFYTHQSILMLNARVSNSNLTTLFTVFSHQWWSSLHLSHDFWCWNKYVLSTARWTVVCIKQTGLSHRQMYCPTCVYFKQLIQVAAAMKNHCYEKINIYFISNVFFLFSHVNYKILKPKRSSYQSWKNWFGLLCRDRAKCSAVEGTKYVWGGALTCFFYLVPRARLLLGKCRLVTKSSCLNQDYYFNQKYVFPKFQIGKICCIFWSVFVFVLLWQQNEHRRLYHAILGWMSRFCYVWNHLGPWGSVAS